jgi:DNA-binding IscR family transcriptional regulator
MTGEFALAVHAIVFLNHKGTICSSETLARNICTNPARVRKVMATLKKVGLVETKEGVIGGYSFHLSAEAVTLKDILLAVGTSAVCSSWRSGRGDLNCMIAAGMSGVMDDVYERLNGVCLEELDKITIADIERRLFAEEPVRGDNPCGAAAPSAEHI